MEWNISQFFQSNNNSRLTDTNVDSVSNTSVFSQSSTVTTDSFSNGNATTISSLSDAITSISTQLSIQHNLDILGMEQIASEFLTIHLPGIVVSTLIIIINIVLCKVLLNICRHNIIHGIFKGCIMDFVSAGEATIVSWELITIFHQYGLPLWTLCAFSCMSVKTYLYSVDCISCPYSHINSYLRKFVSGKEMILRIISQFVGGSVFFHWQSYVWNLGLTDIHVGRAYWMSYGRCASWLSVPTWVGFAFELIGSFLCNISTVLIFDFSIAPSINVYPRIFLSSTVTVSLVLASFYYTGGFFQPLLAFARTYGCVGAVREVSVLDHIIVYWLGATLGAITAMYSGPYLKNCITKCTNNGYSILRVNLERNNEDEENIIYDDTHES